jgi:hypothetical protein
VSPEIGPRRCRTPHRVHVSGDTSRRVQMTRFLVALLLLAGPAAADTLRVGM